MTRIDRLIESLRELGSRDCSHNFDGNDHHIVMVAAAQLERMQAAMTSTKDGETPQK